MGRSIYSTRRGLTVGIAQLGLRKDGRGSVGQEVHDGDTVTVDPFGNLGFRFLGVDAPEVSFMLPAQSQENGDGEPLEATFVDLGDPRWEAFLSEPFSDSFGPIVLERGLRDHLESRVGSGTAANHDELATAATTALRAEVSSDMEDLGQDQESFKFFLAFASEIMDFYGRFLGFSTATNQTPRDLPPTTSGSCGRARSRPTSSGLTSIPFAGRAV